MKVHRLGFLILAGLLLAIWMIFFEPADFPLFGLGRGKAYILLTVLALAAWKWAVTGSVFPGGQEK